MVTQVFISLKVIQFLTNSIRHKSNFSKSNLKKILETMPKEPKHITQVQRQRLKLKEKYQKYVPGRVTLQVLGTGAEGAPKSLYMFTDQSRYLFNCGEGTQRLAHEHKMKLAKLEHIFITHPIWENIGGLPGVSLTIQDVGVPQITLHGPQGLDELFLATKRFIILKDLKIEMAGCNPMKMFEDNVMSVIYVPIMRPEYPDADSSPESSERRQLSDDDDTDYYAHESKRKRSRSRRRRSRSRSKSASGSRTQPVIIPKELNQETRQQRTAMCYICRLHPRPGALSLERCVEAGVPPGPLLGQLKAGEDIVLNSGRVVCSKDVCLPDDPGPVIIVIDCPTLDYLNDLVNNDIFVKYQSGATNDDDLAYVVVHFTPSKVMDDIRYKTWVDKFSLSTQHLVLNDTNKCMGSIAVHRIQYKLNLLHEKLFPLLGDTGTSIVEEEINGGPSKKTKPENNYIQPNTFCNIYLRPKKGLDKSEELHLIPSQYIQETMSVEGFPEALQQLKTELSATGQDSTKNEYPRILFLGTGSCIPNKTRNTSGILVEVSDKCGFLMDCGEGTYGQIIRFFGYERAKHILANLKAVYVSHLHADHHIGLVGILKGRRMAIEALNQPMEPLILFAPKQIRSWLSFYHRRFEAINNDYELLPNGDLILGDNKINSKQKQLLRKTLGLKEINTVFVHHCPNAFGVSFGHENGWKITYSGDTMPCDRLIQLGLNSDILIHEATMEDELSQEAVAKMHSTTSQAIDIGQRMNAQFILLTHFSQRYAKLPRFNDNFTANVAIAFDNMQVRLRDLSLVPLLYPALRLMFAEHYEELEQKSVKRQLKHERAGVSSK